MELEERPLLGLPLGEWARRMRRGSVRVHGRAGVLRLPLGGWELVLGPTPVDLSVDFEESRIRRVELACPVLVGERRGRRLQLESGRIALDGEEIPLRAPAVGLRHFLVPLVRGLSDVSAEARAEPKGDLLLALGSGIEIRVADRVPLTVRGATRGPPEALQLCRPVQLDFGGEGIRISLARLARVRIDHATLHPDGTVDLRGHDAPLVLRRGLQGASVGLSRLVRHGPRFRQVRRFLWRPA